MNYDKGKARSGGSALVLVLQSTYYPVEQWAEDSAHDFSNGQDDHKGQEAEEHIVLGYDFRYQTKPELITHMGSGLEMCIVLLVSPTPMNK